MPEECFAECWAMSSWKDKKERDKLIMKHGYSKYGPHNISFKDWYKVNQHKYNFCRRIYEYILTLNPKDCSYEIKEYRKYED